MLGQQESEPLSRTILSRGSALLLQPISLPFIAWPLTILASLGLLPRWILLGTAPILLTAVCAALLTYRIGLDELEATCLGQRLWGFPFREISSVSVGTVPFGSTGRTRGVVLTLSKPAGGNREVCLASTALLSEQILQSWVSTVSRRASGPSLK